jgi:hypothetical protein
MIKKFENFNKDIVIEDIKANLKDILIDLSDNGIEVEITQFELYNQGYNKIDYFFLVRIGRYEDLILNYHKIDIKDYKDDFLRLVNYMESEDFQFTTLSYYDPSGVKMSYSKSYKLTHGETTKIDKTNQDLISRVFDIKETNNLKMYFVKI